VPNAEEEIENEEAEVVAGEGQVDYELGVDGLLADDEQMNNEFCTDDEDQEFWTDDDNKKSVHLMDDKDYRSFCAFYKSPSKPTVQGADDVGEERGNYVVSEEEEDNQEDDSDEDYVQPDSEDSSAEDEEAAELRKFAHDKKEG
jgi:hypothetical protein